MIENIETKRILIVISSPSGAGKTSVCKKLLELDGELRASISVTTRKPRNNETNGIDYIFISKEDFDKKISNGEFLEYANVFNNKYGTLASSTKDLLNKNFDVLFDIDWQGTQQLSHFEELNLIKFFLVPPDKKELEKRLIQRNQDESDVIIKRLKAYDNDIIHWSDYDHVIINDNLDHCFNQIEKIINETKKKNN